MPEDKHPCSYQKGDKRFHLFLFNDPVSDFEKHILFSYKCRHFGIWVVIDRVTHSIELLFI